MVYVVSRDVYDMLIAEYGEGIAKYYIPFEPLPIMITERDIYCKDEFFFLEKDFEPISKHERLIKSQVLCRKPYNNPIQGRNY